MNPHKSASDQPTGVPLAHWQAPAFPPRAPMNGRYCRVEPLCADTHAADLWAANALDAQGRNWTYLFNDPFDHFSAYRDWLAACAAGRDPQFYAIIDQRTGKATGVASYLRIDPSHGCIEVGNLNFSPLLQGTTAATEAMYLMMANAFTLGYRRYEWKCDSLNEPSRRAAQRLGFSYEGLFRQALVTKGRNRDTAWFSVIDGEWPALKLAFEQWLDPQNFDAEGRQRRTLAGCREAVHG